MEMWQWKIIWMKGWSLFCALLFTGKVLSKRIWWELSEIYLIAYALWHRLCLVCTHAIEVVTYPVCMRVRNFEANESIDYIYRRLRNTYRAFFTCDTHPKNWFLPWAGLEPTSTSRTRQKPIFRMSVSKVKMHGMCSFLLYIYPVWILCY